jgi:hypothetical protein
MAVGWNEVCTSDHGTLLEGSDWNLLIITSCHLDDVAVDDELVGSMELIAG